MATAVTDIRRSFPLDNYELLDRYQRESGRDESF